MAIFSRIFNRKRFPVVKSYPSRGSFFRHWLYRNKQSYAAASTKTRELAQWTPVIQTADEHLLPEREAIIARSQSLCRNGTYGEAAVRQYCKYVVGSGIKFHPTISAKELGISPQAATDLSAELKDRFESWASEKSADATRTFNFYSAQEAVLRGMLVDGDIFATLRLKRNKSGLINDLCFNLIDGILIRNPHDTYYLYHYPIYNRDLNLYYSEYEGREIKSGIEVKEDNEPVAVWILSKDQSVRRVPVWGDISGRQNVLRVATIKSPNQTRGLPFLHNVVKTIRHTEQYDDYELTAAMGAAMVVGILQSDDNNVFGDDAGLGASRQGDPKRDFNLQPNAILNIKNDEQFRLENPTRPNSNYPDYVTSQIRKFAMGIGMPPEVLKGEYLASYTASQGSKLDFRYSVNPLQERIVEDFCYPIYKNWLTTEVLFNDLKLPGYLQSDKLRHYYARGTWLPSDFGHIDPLKTLKASREAIEMGLSTRSQEARRYNNTDFQKNIDTLLAEEEALSSVIEVRNKNLIDKSVMPTEGQSV